MDRWDAIVRIAGICRRVSSPHQSGQEDEVLVSPRLSLGKLHAQCKCREGQKRRPKQEWILLEFKTGEKIKLLNGACMKEEMNNNLLVMSGKVGNKNVEVLRNSECNGVIVERKLVNEADFIGKMDCMMMVDRTLIKTSVARIKVVASFYSRTVDDMCMKDLLFDVIIGKFSGAKKESESRSSKLVICTSCIGTVSWSTVSYLEHLNTAPSSEPLLQISRFAFLEEYRHVTWI